MIKSQIQDLAKATKANQAGEVKLRADMNKELTSFRQEVQKQIESSEQSVRSTLDTCIHCIEQSLKETNQGMNEGFKAILARLAPIAPNSQDESAKRPRPEEKDMQVEPPN